MFISVGYEDLGDRVRFILVKELYNNELTGFLSVSDDVVDVDFLFISLLLDLRFNESRWGLLDSLLWKEEILKYLRALIPRG